MKIAILHGVIVSKNCNNSLVAKHSWTVARFLYREHICRLVLHKINQSRGIVLLITEVDNLLRLHLS